MKIRWLGHSCFEIVSENGTRILTDPFAHESPEYPGVRLSFPTPAVEADIVTISHPHFDHDAVDVVKGNPVIVNKSGTSAKGITFTGFATYHLSPDGLSQDPINNVFCWEADGLKLCHLGDLGHILEKEEIERIKEVDILFVPVGEGFTMPHDVVVKNLRLINPRVVIPMHYKTEATPFLPKSVNDFLAVCDLDASYPGAVLDITRSTMPASPTISILESPHSA